MYHFFQKSRSIRWLEKVRPVGNSLAAIDIAGWKEFGGLEWDPLSETLEDLGRDDWRLFDAAMVSFFFLINNI